MKYSSMSHLLTFAVLSSVSSFAPNSYFSKRTLTRSCLLAVVTGPDGKPASSKQEDIALTLAIIMAHDARSVTVTADQLLNQMSDDLSDEDEEEGRDVSIPYDAAAKNAFEASDKSMAYADFKTTYEADAVTLVKSKQPIDVSIPYDAAAKNAFEVSDKSMAYADFKTTYEADAVALVKSKQPIDVSIPYDAAAKNAFEASDKSMAYADFKTTYEADAVALVKSKQPIDVSIPYDAAAKNVYEASDKSMAYADFKAAYEADAVADVIAKQTS
eukprot:scaffold171_cov284-Chaetoceros_neogracile.AAC.2